MTADRDILPFGSLIAWFKRCARLLPWRVFPTPWSVLVSEIMLQQTQAQTVIPFYLRWMDRFPTLTHLAKASVEEAITYWEGLGYYRRVRSLHQLALRLDQEQQPLPQQEEQLLTLPGIGAYTAAAIASFAFHQRAAPVDGNVTRVMSRYLALDHPPSLEGRQKIIRSYLMEHLPQEEPWVAAEALIELGATVCQRIPLCHACPVNSSCQAFQQNRQTDFPLPPAKKMIKSLEYEVAVIECQSHFLIQQKQTKGLFQGLWLFPHLPLASHPPCPKRWSHALGLSLEKVLAPLPSCHHHFTRFKATLYPWQMISVARDLPPNDQQWCYRWVDHRGLEELPFCAGHRTIKEKLLSRPEPVSPAIGG